MDLRRLDMLDTTMANLVRSYFAQHPVLSRYAGEVCIAITGSLAVGLGGRGADIDAKVLCPARVYEAIRQELIAAGRIGPTDSPEEEFTAVVGDYALEPLEAAWDRVRGHDDLTQLFIYGNLRYLDGDRNLLDPLVSHCRTLPAAVLQRAIAGEQTALDEGLYAYLRSFQNADEVARLLARANMVRSAMRLAFLQAGMAPPYDKHLFRLLPDSGLGQAVAGLVRRFLQESTGDQVEALYAHVAETEDWHAMYAAAAETPAVRFQRAILAGLLTDPVRP